MFCGSNTLCTTPSTLPELKPICIGAGAECFGFLDGWPSPSMSSATASIAARFLVWASFFWRSSSHNCSFRSGRMYAAMRRLVRVAPGRRTWPMASGRWGRISWPTLEFHHLTSSHLSLSSHLISTHCKNSKSKSKQKQQRQKQKQKQQKPQGWQNTAQKREKNTTNMTTRKTGTSPPLTARRTRPPLLWHPSIEEMWPTKDSAARTNNCDNASHVTIVSDGADAEAPERTETEANLVLPFKRARFRSSPHCWKRGRFWAMPEAPQFANLSAASLPRLPSCPFTHLHCKTTLPKKPRPTKTPCVKPPGLHWLIALHSLSGWRHVPRACQSTIHAQKKQRSGQINHDYAAPVRFSHFFIHAKLADCGQQRFRVVTSRVATSAPRVC